MRSLHRALTFAIVALTAPAALAIDRPEPTPQLALRLKTLTLIRPDVTWEQVRDQMRTMFYRTDIDRTGITRATIEKHKLHHRAKQRADIVARQLAWDLDGDGAVTRAELLNALRKEATAEVRRARPPPATQSEHDRLVAEKLEARIALIMKDDADGDGRLTIAEMMDAADRQLMEQRPLSTPRGGLPLMLEWMWALTLDLVPPELDPNDDGLLTLEEYDSLVRAVFDEIDTDRDGHISTSEAEAFFLRIGDRARAAAFEAEVRKREAELKAKRDACGLPMLPASGRFLLVGTHAAQGLSDVALGGDEVEVAVGHLVIEPGGDPLHLALTSRSAQIWIISGAVERIETVLANSWSTSGKVPRVGVVGLPPERVHIAAAATCVAEFYLQEKDTNLDAASREAADTFEILTGRRPDRVAGTYKLSTMRVPSGREDDKAPMPSTKELPLTIPGRPMWQWFQREWPLGLIHLDAAKIVSRVAARPYEQLPGVAGMAQLLDEEALTVLNYSLPFRLAIGRGKIDTIVTPEPDRFRINRKIRIPAGFSGRFVLGRDVPLPDAPERSCIVAEDTGKTIGKRGC